MTMMTGTSGLGTARTIYADRGKIARMLSSQGKQIMGYYCSYPPLEMITAMDFVPFRIQGSMDEPITKADSRLPTIVCPIIRSSLDLALKGKYDFISGFVGAHSCDCQEKFCRIMEYSMDLSFFHYIDMPHVLHNISFDHFKEKLNIFQANMEKYTGRKMDLNRLNTEIHLHNLQRALVRELYDLQKHDPPLLSGSEILQIMISLMCLPVEEGFIMLKEIIEEVKARTDGPVAKKARLMIWGSPMTETGLIDMIEGLDANVVMDDMCVGSRHFFPDVAVTEDPMDAIARRYLGEIKCPRTFRESTTSFENDLIDRFGYLRDFAVNWKVDGVILQSVRYCDSHGYELPALKGFLKKLNLPAIYLEHDYTKSAAAPLKTRVEAFLETIS
jgi:benzoyl-CoA reductase/2-hydroxyglutaryl-CoA dehydratase subunit BcrC/BadD/HgdB